MRRRFGTGTVVKADTALDSKIGGMLSNFEAAETAQNAATSALVTWKTDRRICQVDFTDPSRAPEGRGFRERAEAARPATMKEAGVQALDTRFAPDLDTGSMGFEPGPTW